MNLINLELGKDSLAIINLLNKYLCSVFSEVDAANKHRQEDHTSPGSAGQGLIPGQFSGLGSWHRDRSQSAVVVNGPPSEQRPIRAGGSQGSAPGPILFNAFPSDITEGLLGKVCLFAGDAKVCNRIVIPGGIHNMKNDLALQETWSKM